MPVGEVRSCLHFHVHFTNFYWLQFFGISFELTVPSLWFPKLTDELTNVKICFDFIFVKESWFYMIL